MGVFPCEYVARKYSPVIYKVALTRVGNRHDAEDITQDVLIRYMKHEDELQNEGHLEKWLVRVAINCSKSLFSSAWFRKRTELDENMHAPDTEIETIWTVVLQLPQDCRSAVHLFYHEGFTIKQIAYAMGKKEAAVKMLLHRGRERLKEILGEDY